MEKNMKITEAQFAAVADLPFVLSHQEIMEQVNGDGSTKERETRDPAGRVQELAYQQMLKYS